MTSNYIEQGFELRRGILSEEVFFPVEQRCLGIVEALAEDKFDGLNDPRLIKFLTETRSAEQHLYSKIREYEELQELSLNSTITDTVKSLLGKDEIVLLEKIPFRIDCPMVLRELAVWHQDLHYVKGALETVTAWIPLFDVSFKEGCLLIMPGSHKFGPLTHDVQVLGKKFYPSSIFENSVRYVEMKRGDVLFFDSRLLHSSGNNISETIRFSIQARYLGADEQSDSIMGNRIPV